jgi:glycosyltransferase involved in cell wall biosynthesis
MDADLSYQRKKLKLLIFVITYNAEKTIQNVLSRIPAKLIDEYHVEVLIIDDASGDLTFDRACEIKNVNALPFRLHVLVNPENQGYGGNQKLGYHFAIERGFDFVALLHGDGKYAPECLPDLVRPLSDEEADAVFGSRMMTSISALKGGMPFYKFLGNKILSWFENLMLRTNLSEFHSGYRVYSIAALKRIPWQQNTNQFHFDTEIIIQFVFAGLRIKELPIPTYYSREICYVNGVKYAWDVTRAVLKARAQEMGLFYDRRFDCAPNAQENVHYQLKSDYLSPHTLCLNKIPPGSRVLDLGCAGGYMSVLLKQRRNCQVTGVDFFPLGPGVEIDELILHDLNNGPPFVKFEDYGYVLLLDIIEHLASPECFIDKLRDAMKLARNTQLLISAGNIGFLIPRLMLLLGQFNYGKRGILDITHSRLFTFSSLQQLLEQAGFQVTEVQGIPGPYPLALGHNWLSNLLLWINSMLIHISKRLFAYQIFMTVKPLPSLEYLLCTTQQYSTVRMKSFDVNDIKKN